MKNDQQGVILAAILIISSALILVGIALTSASSSQYRIANINTFGQNAMLAAEAGIEQSINSLNQNDSFGGYPTQQTFFDNDTQGIGRFQTTISPNPADTNGKIINSTGYVYRKSAPSDVVSKRSIRVTVVGTASSGYSVNSGPGGLIMNGSATITNSSVYVNGYIKMEGSSRIGSDSAPATVHVANNNCPTGNNPGPTYPTTCTGIQPIQIRDWSSVAIIGTTCATGQTQSKFPNTSNNNRPAQIRAGTSGGEGLKIGCTAPSVTTPTYDRAAHIAAVTTTGTGNSNTYVCNSWPHQRTWPANLRLNGDVRISGSCDVTISGNVYITGNLLIDGAAKVRVADSVGTNRPYIIADGTIKLDGAGSVQANSYGTGAHFISFKSSAACNPSCTSLSGNDLKNSESVETVHIGGGTNLPGIIFQSYWGKITVTGSGNIGAAIGQTVDLNGAGTIVFGTELGSGSKTWTITSYQQTFD